MKSKLIVSSLFLTGFITGIFAAIFYLNERIFEVTNLAQNSFRESITTSMDLNTLRYKDKVFFLADVLDNTESMITNKGLDGEYVVFIATKLLSEIDQFESIHEDYYQLSSEDKQVISKIKEKAKFAEKWHAK